MIHKLRFFCLSICCTIMMCAVIQSCAVMVPPGGGPKDTLPPVLVAATPKDSSLQFNSERIVLEFNEYVLLQNVQQELMTYPMMKKVPNISGYLRKVTIDFKETLLPNTTYALNFGNAIKDANEGNTFANYTYVFSTGNHLDSCTIMGNVKLAETGGVDSTLLAVLYADLSDTAVYKTSPMYYTKVDTAGNFKFLYLPTEKPFHLFVIPNTYMKNYSDSTMLFAFAPQTITTSAEDSVRWQLYAYQEYKPQPKTKVLSPKQLELLKVKQAKEPLEVKTSADNAVKQSLLKDLEITFNKPLKQFNAEAISLLDTSFQPIKGYSIVKNEADSTYSSFVLKNKWEENKPYMMIVNTKAAIDSFDNQLKKSDTIHFSTKSERDYASFVMTFPDVDTAKHPIVQLVLNNKVMDSFVIGTDKKVVRQLYEPGEYQLRLLYDTNNNGKWDPGSLKQKIQPEIVIAHKKKMLIKADFENELEIFFHK